MTVKTESKKHLPIRRRRESASAEPRHAPPAEKHLVQEVPEPRRQRRALSHVGGDVLFQGGSAAEQEVLVKALDVTAEEDEVMVDVHGFHSYPARLHPGTARGIIAGLTKPGATVLDPFCGSGTVIVEAKALGRKAIGSDLNPLAVELSWLKSRAPTQKLVEEMLTSAMHIAEVAEERRLAKADPYLRYGEEDRERYPVHILLELDSLAHGVGLVKKTEVQRMLRLVISSMLTKLSHSEGDTTRRKTPRRLPGGFAIQLFVQKSEELAERLSAYRTRIGELREKAYVGCADARDLAKIESDSVDLVLTSPPYPGVYDYLDHHLHRIRWLGLREGGLRNGEIGARREYRRLDVEEAAQRWQEEIGATLYEARRVLAQDGRGVIVVADSVIDRQALRADEQIRKVAARAGIDIVCIASQERPLFLHGAERAFSDRPRMEHVVVFRPGQRPHRKDWVSRAIDKELQALKDRPRPARFENREKAVESGAREARRPLGKPAARNESTARDHATGPRRRNDAESGRQASRAFDRRDSEGQRNSHDRTWGSKPRGPVKPRSKPGPKPR